MTPEVSCCLSPPSFLPFPFPSSYMNPAVPLAKQPNTRPLLFFTTMDVPAVQGALNQRCFPRPFFFCLRARRRRSFIEIWPRLRKPHFFVTAIAPSGLGVLKPDFPLLSVFCVGLLDAPPFPSPGPLPLPSLLLSGPDNQFFLGGERRDSFPPLHSAF